MAYIFEIPRTNPLRPLAQFDLFNNSTSDDKLFVLNPDNNYKDFDEYFFALSAKEWEEKMFYIQPFQQSNTIKIQWLGSDTTLANYQYSRLLDSNGLTFNNKAVTVVQETGTFASKKHYSVTIQLYDVPEGTYFLQLRHKNASNKYINVAFEPFKVKAAFTNTLNIAYTNTSNDWDTIFQSGAFTFQMRVPGAITEVIPKAKITAYEDQPLDYEILSGTPYREYEVTFFNIPRWKADLINRITLCDTFTLDGKALSRMSDSELKPANNKAPLSDYTLSFRERNNTSTLDLTHMVSAACVMPQTDLFWVERLTRSAVPGYYTVRKGFKGKRALIAYLNANYPITSGYWAEDDRGNLVQQGAITDALTIAAADILPYGIECQMHGVGDFDFTFYKGAIATTVYYAMEFSDGTASVNKTSYTGSPNPIHTFADERRDHFVRFFFSDVEQVEDTGTQLVVDWIYGNFAPSCKDFRCYLDAALGGFLTDPFKFVTDGVFDFMWIQGQNLNTYEVDKIIRRAYENRAKFSGSANMYIDGQLTLAPPSVNDAGLLEILSKVKEVVTIQHD